MVSQDMSGEGWLLFQISSGQAHVRQELLDGLQSLGIEFDFRLESTLRVSDGWHGPQGVMFDRKVMMNRYADVYMVNSQP